jgi:Gp157 protein
MQLYKLTEQYEQAFTDMVDADTGEVNDKALAMLDALQGDVKDKGLAVAAYIRNHDADVDALKAEEQRLAARRKQLESRMDWLRGYLLDNMVRCGISEIKSPYFTIKTKKCPPSVKVLNDADLPQKYIRVKEQISVDKVQIKQDICSGIEVPGATIEQNTTIVIK